MPDKPLAPGDRVQVAETYVNGKLHGQTGTVQKAVASGTGGVQSVRVLIDGQARPVLIHAGYLAKVAAKKK